MALDTRRSFKSRRVPSKKDMAIAFGLGSPMNGPMSTHLPRLSKSSLLWCLVLWSSFAGAQNLTDGQIDVVSARLAEAALESWEIGTRAQTILELNATEYSVFSSTSLPPPASVPSSLASSGALVPFFTIAHDVVANRSTTNNGTTGPQPLISGDGSAGDPASIGVCVLLANWTKQDSGQLDYAGAATDQLNYLLQDVPRTSDGAISHRVSEVQLWSDFVYMVPPFLAYYGVISRNRTLLEESYTQIKLYRNYLRDNTTGMWRHVLLGTSNNDEGFWSTGNGWAAAGILRVLATMLHSEYTNTFKSEQSDLANWVQEIHTAIYAHLDNTTNLFTNYADQPVTATGNFYDASSTTLLASTVYRASLLLNQHTYLPFAERSRKTLFSTNSTSGITSNTSSSLVGYQHLTPEGWLTPVVNPDDYGVIGNESAEGQGFVVQLHAGYREWVEAGSKTTSGALLRVGAHNLNLQVLLGVGIVLGLGGVMT